MRRIAYFSIALLQLAPLGAGLVGRAIGPGLLHPMRLNPARLKETAEMLERTGAAKEDFSVRALDGVELRGWKIRSRSANGDWVLLFHGVSDNRTGVLGHAEFLLRHGCKVGVPASGRELVSLLDKQSPKNESDPVSLKE